MGNDFARNFLIFGVNNSSSSHTDNRKSNFLVLDEGPTQGITDTTGAVEKKLVFNLVNQIQNFAYVCITMVMRVTCKQIKQRLTNLKQKITYVGTIFAKEVYH